MAPVVKASAFWRQAGLSYLQYLSVCSQALRLTLKVINYYDVFNFIQLHTLITHILFM
jgi:hypothetical protein